jgi:hypothetical protein
MPINDKRKDHELTALYGVIDRCGIVISEKRLADFTGKDIQGDLKRLLGKDTEAPTLRISPIYSYSLQHNSISISQWAPVQLS